MCDVSVRVSLGHTTVWMQHLPLWCQSSLVYLWKAYVLEKHSRVGSHIHSWGQQRYCEPATEAMSQFLMHVRPGCLEKQVRATSKLWQRKETKQVRGVIKKVLRNNSLNATLSLMDRKWYSKWTVWAQSRKKKQKNNNNNKKSFLWFKHVIWQIDTENICWVCVFLGCLLQGAYNGILQI